jgi:hypothetical protein
MGDSPMKIYKKAALFLIISITLCSCGASHHLTNKVFFKDPDFTFSHLRKNGIIIAGISSQQIQLTPEERIKYSSILSNVFLEKLKDAQNIRVINTSQLITRISKEKYLEMMDYFDTEEILRQETIHFLGDTLPEAKYIFFAHIDNENIIDRTSDEYVENEEGKKEKQIKYEKTYLLTIEFQMYDIPGEKLVLDNVIYNQAENTENRTTTSGCVGSCLNSLMHDILFGEPAKIDREEVLAKISERFAKDLAKVKN